MQTDTLGTFQEVLKNVCKGKRGAKNLAREEARDALDHILSGHAQEAQVGAFLAAMRLKDATVEELLGFLDALRQHATTIHPRVQDLLDCGNPYDGRNKFLPLDLAASITACAAGVPVVLHGTRGLPPKRGITTAQLLEALGIATDIPPAEVQKRIESTGFGYLHAPRFIPRVEGLKPLREALGFRTFLNTCEIMLNPAGARRRLMGAAHLPFLEKMTSVASREEAVHAMTVMGAEGSCEVLLRPTKVVEWVRGEVRTWVLEPEALGLRPSDPPPVADVRKTAETLVALLEGKAPELEPGLLLNAGVRIYLGGKAGDVAQGIETARAVVASGQAREKLEALRA